MCMKRSNKYALMSAALLAGAVSFSSCSNDEDGAVSYGNGEKAEAQMAISFQRFAKDGRGLASDANIGDAGAELLNSIKDMVILPGKGTTFANPVRMGGLTVEITGDDKTITPDGLTAKVEGSEYYTNTTVSLAEKTNVIKFFGGDVWTGSALKATVTYPGTAANAPASQTAKTYNQMAGLYYYGMDNKLQYSKVDYATAQESDWEDVLNTGLSVNDEVKAVRVDDINYAVGVLHSTVKLGSDAKMLFVAPDYDVTKIKDDGNKLFVPEEDEVNIPEGEGIQIVGYIINDQQENVNVVNGFTPESSATATVYDAVAADVAAANLTTTATAVNYTRLFATPDSQEKVVVTLRCKNNTTSALAIRNVWDAVSSIYKVGLIAPGNDFYLVVNLVKDRGTNNGAPSIIAKDYNTKANFTINSTFNGYSVDPEVKTIEATVGVVVDLEWENGYVFNEDIN